jgi:hypothetical protein
MSKENKSLFCIGCGAELPVQANFCSQCGQSQASGSTPSDRSAIGSVCLNRPPGLNKGALPLEVYLDDQEVYLDDQYVGNITCLATARFNAEAGAHRMFVKLFNMKSNLLVVDLRPGQQLRMTCGFRSFWSEAPYIAVS